MSCTWEVDARPWEGEVAASDAGSDSDDAEFDPSAANAVLAQELLYEMVVDLKLHGVLNATQACTLAFWCSKATNDTNDHTFFLFVI